MLALFYISLAAIAYVYFGYPLALRSDLFGRIRAFRRATSHPTVSIIVPAHNEEAGIEAKLHNLLALDYPRDRVEILIGSDGSSDRTEEIVGRFTREGVGLISFAKQLGKSTMQNGLVAFATGEILLFTDADCLLPRDALSLLIENFADLRVGLATARPQYVNESETSITENESLYLRYETWLREEESARGILAMASGSCFAMRRALWRPLGRAEGDDFVLPLRVAEAGQINRFDSRVVALTRLSHDNPSAMLRLKSRIISKDFGALLARPAMLNPFRHGALAISLWSHKLLRWLVPYFLFALFAASLSLRSHPLVRVSLLLQVALYTLATAGFTRRSGYAGFLFTIPRSFCLVNFAALLGTLRCVAGRASGRWTPDRISPARPHSRVTAADSGAE